MRISVMGTDAGRAVDAATLFADQFLTSRKVCHSHLKWCKLPCEQAHKPACSRLLALGNGQANEQKRCHNVVTELSERRCSDGKRVMAVLQVVGM
jgi:hypothetical protein